MGEQTWLNPQDRHVVDLVTAVTRHRELSEGGRWALLDALDAVPRVRRDGIDDHSHVPAQAVHAVLDRAERAERERDRLRVTISTARNIVGQWLADGDGDDTDKADLYDCLAAALSADADADAEPTDGAQRIRAERQRQIAAEGYTAEHDRHHDPDVLMEAAECYLVAARRGAQGEPVSSDPSRLPAYVRWPWEPEGWKPLGGPERNLEKAGALAAAALDRVTDAEPSRAEGDEYETVGGGGCEHMWWTDRRCIYCGAHRDAEGGRPREADPQGPSIGSDASVDGGGDDGRSRAAQAIANAIPDRGKNDTFSLKLNAACRYVDAAIASGGVVTREDAERRLREVQSEADRRYGEDAALWEALIRGLDPYCPTDCGTCPDCRALQVVEPAGQESRPLTHQDINEWVEAYWKSEARVRELEAVLRDVIGALSHVLGKEPSDA